ncbi:MAG: hypothetical protein ACW98F_18270 [Candidatus Hodarchaeales archaeon]
MTKKIWNYGGGILIFCLLSLGIGTHPDWTVQGRIEEKSFDVEWDNTFGGTNDDSLSSAIQCTDGGFLFAGNTQSFGTGTDGEADAWVIKTNANGQSIWNRTFGEESIWDSGDYIIQTTDYGFFLTGFSGDDNWVMKLDGSGHQEWNFSLEISQFEFVFVYTIIPTTDGGFLVTLNANNEDTGSRFLVKFDATGTQQWNSTLAVDTHMFFNQMINTLDGGSLLIGGTGQYPGTNLFLLKLDDTGTAEWNVSLGGPEPDVASSVIQMADGSFLIAGFTTSYALSSSDFWLVKTDSSGHLLWNTTYGGLFAQSASSMIQTTDGGFLLAGSATDSSDDEDIWLVKTNATGAHIWNRTFGGTGLDFPVSVFQTADEKFVVAGTTSSFGAGNDDFFLLQVSVSDKNTSSGPSFEFPLVLFCFVVLLGVFRKRRP